MMTVELKRIDRISLPMGILDFTIQADQQRIYTACMDGIYAIEFNKEVEPQTIESEKIKSEKIESQKTDSAKSEESKPKKTSHQLCRIGKHESYVSSVALLEEYGELVSTAFDGTLQIRNVTSISEDLQPHVNKRVHDFWSWDMALSPDQLMVASVSGQYLAGAEDYSPAPTSEPTLKILQSRTGKLLSALDMLPPVQCVAFDASSRYVAAANLMGDIAVWETGTGQKVASWRTKEFTSWGIIKSHCYIGGIYAISFAPDSETLLVAGMGEMRDPMAGNGKQLWHRYAWRKSTPELVQQIKRDEAGEGLMETLAWHPSGKQFVMGGRLRGGNWNLGVFDAEEGKLIGQAKTGMRITTARFSRDGQHLYLAGMQGQPQPKDQQFPGFGYLEQYSWKN